LTGGDQSVENLVVADLIPSGFEIENPRVSTSADLTWVNQAQNKMSPAYMDVRDDRLLLFTDLNSRQTARYYYMLRAINAGTFQLPAISVEAMYDPDYKSYYGEGMVRISPR
ncbi:MAG: hypothetical protein KDD99_29975, partial [Bacteroidetes bacterium]|nr:hypothetical protein [Bacteroidota bacterium]